MSYAPKDYYAPCGGMASAALIAAYQAVAHRCAGVTLEQFCALFAGWQVMPLQLRGEVIGAVLINGSEMHIALRPEAQNKTWLRGIIRQHVGDVIRAHGVATTKVMNDHAIGHRLAKLIGFKQSAANETLTEYQCTEVAL